MKTLAAAAVVLALGVAAPAFAQTNDMNDTTMTNNTTMKHTHHHKTHKGHKGHKSNNTMMNGTDTTSNLNQNEMNSTAPAQ